MVASVRIADEHGSFHRIRQVAPMCTPSLPHKIHGSSGPRESTPHKRHLDDFSYFCVQTDHTTSKHLLK